MIEYADKNLKCSCGQAFTWTRGEQKFMQTLFDNGVVPLLAEPKRCPDCRLKKRIKNKNKIIYGSSIQRGREVHQRNLLD